MTSPWNIPLPQGPVIAGESGHLNDHNTIKNALGTLWGNAHQSTINVAAPPYNADPTGTNDSTSAIQSAINAVYAAGGGAVYFPAGTYLVTPASSTSAALVLNNGTTGYQGVRLIADTTKVTAIKRTAAGPILAVAGPASDVSGATHCQKCSIEGLLLSGNNLTGTLVQAYYANEIVFRGCQFNNSADVGVDVAEFWDSRFEDCTWNSCGSATGGTTAPNLWLRNSAAASGFGYSTDTVNNVYLYGCRFEQPLTGAVRIERGLGTNTGQPYSIYMLSVKFETAFVNGGPMLFVDTTARDIHLQNAHVFMGGFQSGWSTAVDAITFGPQFGSLRDILIFNSTATACIANGVTLNAPLSKAQIACENVRGSYTGGANPTGGHINFGTATGGFVVINCNADNGNSLVGNVPSTATGMVYSGIGGNGLASFTNGAAVSGNVSADLQLAEFSSASQAFGIHVAGDTWNRFLALATGALSWGSGAGAQDVVLGRSTTGVLSLTSGILDTQHGTKTNTGAAVIATTFASGTAAQLSDTARDYMIYFTVGTAGTGFSVAIGPTSTPANTVVSSNTPNAGESFSVRLPAGWFLKWAGSSTTLANQIAIGC